MISMIADFLGYMTTGMVWVASLILGIFTFFTSGLTFILLIFVNFLETVLSIASIVVGILRGTYGLATGFGDIIAYINIPMSAAMLFLVLVWLLSIDDRAKKKGFGGWFTIAYGDIQSLMNILSFIFTIIMTISNFVIDLVYKLIKMIPVIE